MTVVINIFPIIWEQDKAHPPGRFSTSTRVRTHDLDLVKHREWEKPALVITVTPRWNPLMDLVVDVVTGGWRYTERQGLLGYRSRA